MAAAVTPRVVGHEEFDGRGHPSFGDIHAVWAEFLLHDRTVNENWERLYAEFAGFQFYLVENDIVLAEGNTIPVVWDGSTEHAGIDWAFAEGSRAGPPTTLCAIQVMIRKEAHGRGLSTMMLERMTQLAATHGLDCLIAPVRPTLKHRYPLTPIERYVTWRREDGQLLDPWLRVHERLGAEILGPAHESMRVEAPVASWEEWTGQSFPEDGDYVVEGGLVPMRVAGCVGLYVEPNVWMRHPLPASP